MAEMHTSSSQAAEKENILYILIVHPLLLFLCFKLYLRWKQKEAQISYFSFFSLPSLSSCSWLARTDPRDVARVESKTVIVTQNQRDTVPTPLDGGVSQLGRWMSQEEFDKAMAQRFPGCMKGTTKKDVMFKYSTAGESKSTGSLFP